MDGIRKKIASRVYTVCQLVVEHGYAFRRLPVRWTTPRKKFHNLLTSTDQYKTKTGMYDLVKTRSTKIYPFLLRSSRVTIPISGV